MGEGGLCYCLTPRFAMTKKKYLLLLPSVFILSTVALGMPAFAAEDKHPASSPNRHWCQRIGSGWLPIEDFGPQPLATTEGRAVAGGLRSIQETRRQSLQARKDGQALSYLDHTISLTPKDPQLYYLRSIALARLKQFDAAIDDVNKGLALYPKNVNADTKNCHALRLAIFQATAKADKVAEEKKNFAAYLKDTSVPDITFTPEVLPNMGIVAPRWHPNKPMSLLDGKKHGGRSPGQPSP